MKIVSLAYCVSTRSRRAHLRRRPARLFVWAAAPWVALLVVGGLPSSTYAATVPLGTSESFVVLAGSTVTNTGPSVISGDLGVSPGTAVTGFPPGMLAPGTVHAADAVALQAQTDLTIAYKNAFGRTGGGAISAPLGGGTTLFAGVYTSAADIFVGGDLTLDGGGDPNALFVFQAKTGTLITAAGTTSGVPNTRVLLRNGAQACNVFWQVGSSATIETSTQFAGNILALTSITLKTGATLYGRALARNGAVTLDTNRITKATCATVAASPPSIASTSATTGAGQPVTVSLLGTDATGAPLTYSVVSGPSHGTLGPINQGAGTVVYTPSPSYTGPDSFTYQITSSNGTSTTAPANITVTPTGNGATTGTTGGGATTGAAATTGTTSTGTTTGAAATTGTGTTTGASGTTGTTETGTTTDTSGTTGSAATTTGATTTSSKLPFTGLNVLWPLLGGIALLLAGTVVRRFGSRPRAKP